MMVSQVSENGFLGMDLLSQAGAIINFEEMYIQLYEQKIPLLTKEGRRIVNSLITRESVRLPKNSQNIVGLDLRRGSSMIGLVEPRTSVLDHYQVIGGRNLGNAANLRMKVINPVNPHDVIIPSGTSIAYYVCESALQLPRKEEPESCAQALYNGIFAKFGFSRIIHMDRTAYFMSELVAELARLGNSKKIRSHAGTTLRVTAWWNG